MLGFQEFLLYGPKAPAACRDANRQYAWALLDPESAIQPADDAIRIEPPRATTDSPHPNPKPKRRVPTVNASTNPNGNGHAPTNDNGHAPTNATASANGHASKTNGQARKATGRKAELQDTAALIEQAEKFRTALHDLVYQASGLVKALKQHRRQSRAIRNTIASLRQLKTLGV